MSFDLNSSELGVQGTAKAIEQYILLKKVLKKKPEILFNLIY